MLLDARISVFDPKLATLLCLDASADVGGSQGYVKYEDTPSGCGAGEIDLGLTYSETVSRGYWTTMNIVEISTADDTMQAPINTNTTTFTTAEQAAGVKARIYVTSTQAYDIAQGEDTPQIYLWDGTTLTMRIPVYGVGTDGTGPYIAALAPLSGGGNPTAFAAYGTGTYVGRRRYCGRIVRTEGQNLKMPSNKITLVGLVQTLEQGFGTFTLNNDDCGDAIYQCIDQFAARWPFLTIAQANFPTVGQTYTGSYSMIALASMLNYIMTAIASGDFWIVRVGHDRVVKLMKLYTQTTNTYTFNRTLVQGVVNFEPLNVDDQRDASSMYNSVMVIGDTDPTTKQQVRATAQDGTSITEFYQIDAQPVTIMGLKTTTDCQNAAIALLNQNSLAASQFKFRVYTRNDSTVSSSPSGLANGDVVRGIDNITLTRFDDTGSVRNQVPDSEFQYTSGLTALWTLGSGIAATGSVNGSNALIVSGTGSPSGSQVAYSPVIDVTPGQTVTLCGYIDATQCSGGQPYWALYHTDGATPLVSGQAAFATIGNASRWKVEYVIPSGVYQVVALFNSNNTTIASGKQLVAAQPELDKGTTSGDYTANLAAPNVYGLAASVVTTIDVHGLDRWQDVTFSAIEPDWNAAMHQRAMALANALHANSAPPAYVDAYIISPNAYPPTWTGLTVTTPTFNAIFGVGTGAKTVPSSSFTVAASATSWVWLNPALTWTVKQDPSPVSGSILYGFFQASATAVIGYTPKASLGVSNNQPGVGGSTITIPASGSGSPALTNYVTGAATYGCDLTFTPTWTALQTSIKQLRVIAAPHGLATTSSWLYGTSGPWGGGVVTADQLPASGSPVTVHIAHLPTGQACDLYAYLEGYDGSYVYPATNPIAQTAAQTFNKSAAPKMPAGATISASAVTISVVDAGMKTDIYGGGGSYTGFNVALFAQLTLGDTNTPTSASWGYQWILGTRAHTTSTPTDYTTYDPHPQPLDLPFGNGTSVDLVYKPVTPGKTIDVAVWIADAQGNVTNCVQIASSYTVPKVQSGSGIGPIIGRPHMWPVAGTGGDPTNGLWDATNNVFDHNNAMSHGVQSALNSLGQYLNNEFAGAVEQGNGSWTNINGTASTTQYPLASGQPFTASVSIAMPASPSTLAALILGTETNGYEIRWSLAGAVQLRRWVGGVSTTLATGTTVALDANYHSFRLTITPGATNTVEASFDGQVLSATDSGLTLTSGTWPVSIWSGGATGTVRHYQPSSAGFHRTGIHTDYQNTVQSGGGINFASALHSNKILDNIADGSTYGRPLLTRLSTGRPLIDFSESIHLNKILDNIADGSTYARVKSTELASGGVKQLNDGTNVRTASLLAGLLNTDGSINNQQLQLPMTTNGILLASASGTTKYATSARYFGAGLDNGLLIECRARSASNATTYLPLIVFGAQDAGTPLPTNGYYFKVFYNGTAWKGEVHKVTAGSDPGPLGGISGTITENPADGTYHTIRLWAYSNGTGLEIHATFDGVDLGTWTDTSSPWYQGYSGFSSHYSGTDVHIGEWHESTSAHLHYSMPQSYKTNWDSSGNMTASSGMKTYVPNSLANLVSNLTVQTYSGSSGALAIWFTSTIPSSNPNGSTLPTWKYPDQSGGIYPTAAACGTSSSSPWMSWTGLGSTTYIGVKYSIAAGTFSVVYGPSSSQPTDTQISQCVGDGSIVVVISAATTGSAIPSGGGGGKTVTGGGGHQLL